MEVYILGHVRFLITGCEVAPLRQPSVNGDWLCQWERAIFDPHRIDTPQQITENFVTDD